MIYLIIYIYLFNNIINFNMTERNFLNDYNFLKLTTSKENLIGFGKVSAKKANEIRNQYDTIENFIDKYNNLPNTIKSYNPDEFLHKRLSDDFIKYIIDINKNHAPIYNNYIKDNNKNIIDNDKKKQKKKRYFSCCQRQI